MYSFGQSYQCLTMTAVGSKVSYRAGTLPRDVMAVPCCAAASQQAVLSIQQWWTNCRNHIICSNFESIFSVLTLLAEHSHIANGAVTETTYEVTICSILTLTLLQATLTIETLRAL